MKVVPTADAAVCVRALRADAAPPPEKKTAAARTETTNKRRRQTNIASHRGKKEKIEAIT
jgi:hypothetical protein